MLLRDQLVLDIDAFLVGIDLILFDSDQGPLGLTSAAWVLTSHYLVVSSDYFVVTSEHLVVSHDHFVLTCDYLVVKMYTNSL